MSAWDWRRVAPGRYESNGFAISRATGMSGTTKKRRTRRETSFWSLSYDGQYLGSRETLAEAKSLARRQTHVVRSR